MISVFPTKDIKFHGTPSIIMIANTSDEEDSIENNHCSRNNDKILSYNVLSSFLSSRKLCHYPARQSTIPISSISMYLQRAHHHY